MNYRFCLGVFGTGWHNILSSPPQTTKKSARQFAWSYFISYVEPGSNDPRGCPDPLGPDGNEAPRWPPAARTGITRTPWSPPTPLPRVAAAFPSLNPKSANLDLHWAWRPEPLSAGAPLCELSPPREALALPVGPEPQPRVGLRRGTIATIAVGRLPLMFCGWQGPAAPFDRDALPQPDPAHNPATPDATYVGAALTCGFCSIRPRRGAASTAPPSVFRTGDAARLRRTDIRAHCARLEPGAHFLAPGTTPLGPLLPTRPDGFAPTLPPAPFSLSLAVLHAKIVPRWSRVLTRTGA